MTEVKRGRPAKAKPESALTVKVANAVYDGKGGFLPVGATFDAVDAASLKAKGLAE